jgi:hypothetical protein
MVTTSTQTTTNVPWTGAQPYMTAAMQQAYGSLASGSGFNAPNFPTYVGMSPQTQVGLGSNWTASQGWNPLAGQSEGAISSILGGDINNKYNDLYSQAGNPYFEQAVQGQADRTAADVQRQFGGLGRIGSAADTGALVDQIGNMRTQALSNQWNANIANQTGILNAQTQGQLGAVGAAPGAYQQRFLPGNMQLQVGAQYDDLAQRQLQSQLDAFNTQQQSDWNRIGAYNGILGGSGATGFSTSTSKVAQPNNFFGNLLGGALGGASVGNQIGGASGAGLGALAGGGLGALSGLFNF